MAFATELDPYDQSVYNTSSLHSEEVDTRFKPGDLILGHSWARTSVTSPGAIAR
ncbi:MAG: hypothetical protein R2818_07410 [Flavobacteriales bacterium]